MLVLTRWFTSIFPPLSFFHARQVAPAETRVAFSVAVVREERGGALAFPRRKEMPLGYIT